jgi:hypothetical protein
MTGPTGETGEHGVYWAEVPISLTAIGPQMYTAGTGSTGIAGDSAVTATFPLTYGFTEPESPRLLGVTASGNGVGALYELRLAQTSSTTWDALVSSRIIELGRGPYTYTVTVYYAVVTRP